MKYLLFISLFTLFFFQENIVRAGQTNVISTSTVRSIIINLRGSYPVLRILPVSLILGMIETESNFNTHAKSSKNALGLMQLKPGTFSEMVNKFSLTGSQIYKPVDNITAGMFYMYWLLSQSNDDINTTVQMYNVGPTGYKHGRRALGYFLKVRKNQLKFELGM